MSNISFTIRNAIIEEISLHLFNRGSLTEDLGGFVFTIIMVSILILCQIVLKAVSLIHRLTRDGDESLTKDFLHLPNLFSFANYLDQSTSEAVGESQFIASYVQYMSHKFHTYNELGYWIERRFRDSISPMEWINSLPIQVLSFFP